MTVKALVRGIIDLKYCLVLKQKMPLLFVKGSFQRCDQCGINFLKQLCITSKQTERISATGLV